MFRNHFKYPSAARRVMTSSVTGRAMSDARVPSRTENPALHALALEVVGEDEARILEALSQPRAVRTGLLALCRLAGVGEQDAEAHAVWLSANPDAHARAIVAKAMDDPEILGRMARHDPDIHVRVAALSNPRLDNDDLKGRLLPRNLHGVELEVVLIHHSRYYRAETVRPEEVKLLSMPAQRLLCTHPEIRPAVQEKLSINYDEECKDILSQNPGATAKTLDWVCAIALHRKVFVVLNPACPDEMREKLLSRRRVRKAVEAARAKAVKAINVNPGPAAAQAGASCNGGRNA